MDAVVEVIWKAQYSPYIPSAGMFWPTFGPTLEDRAREKPFYRWDSEDRWICIGGQKETPRSSARQ